MPSAQRTGAGERIRGANTRPRLLFVVNVDWFFLSHRLPLARAARDRGMDVTIAAAEGGSASAITREGFDFVPMPLSRKGMGPLAELRALGFLFRLYRRIRPDVVHHVTIKPVLYGSIAARFAPVGGVVNAISGLGYVFTGGGDRRLFRRLVEAAYRLALRAPRTKTIFQNPEDRDAFVQQGLARFDDTVLIRGSGVDCLRFRESPETSGEAVVVLPARMLWEKGVGVFVEAARILRQRFPTTRFVLVGRTDPDNPAAVSRADIESWVRDGLVEWWGHREDMPAVLAAATLVVLPTHYGEGLPKALLEAAATGRALVATDIPGCREIVRPEVNGLLVPPRDAAELAEAIARLLDSPAERTRFGKASRRIAETEFAEPLVVEQTLALYDELLRPEWSSWLAATARP